MFSLKNLFKKGKNTKSFNGIDFGDLIQVKGSFEGTVTDKNGNIKQVIPLQENIITEFGMDCYFGGNINSMYWNDWSNLKNEAIIPANSPIVGSNMNSGNSNNIASRLSLYVGDGVGTPDINHPYLYNPRLYTNGHSASFAVSDYESPNSEHPNHVKVDVTLKNLVITPEYYAYNLTELGIGMSTDARASIYDFEKFYADNNQEFRNSITNTASSPNKHKGYSYALITHANFKDDNGNNITVSLEPGEKLTISYTISYYVKIEMTSGSFTLQRINQDRTVTNTTYDYKCILQSMGKPSTYSYAKNGLFPLAHWGMYRNIAPSAGEKNKYGFIGFGYVNTINEEESPDSDFSNFNLDDFGNALFATRQQSLQTGATISTIPNLDITAYRNAFKSLSHLQSEEKKAYIDANVSFKEWDCRNVIDIQTQTKSQMIQNNNINAYHFNNITEEKFPEEYAMFGTVPSREVVSIVRYSFNTGVVTTDENPTRIRAFTVTTYNYNGTSVGSFSPTFIFIVSERGTNRGISKTAHEYLQWAFKSSYGRYEGA